MGIGELARRAGIAPSAIRYYERVGLLAPPARANGRRAYTPDALPRLAIVLHARRLGLGIAEIRRLVGSNDQGPPATIWRSAAAPKIDALDALIMEAETMKAGLERISACDCDSLSECGNRLVKRHHPIAPDRAATTLAVTKIP